MAPVPRSAPSGRALAPAAGSTGEPGVRPGASLVSLSDSGALAIEEAALEAELLDFMTADLGPVQADPVFRERLREELWDMVVKDGLAVMPGATRGLRVVEDDVPEKPGGGRDEGIG